MTAKQAKALVSEYALRLAHCIGKPVTLVWPNGHAYTETILSVEYAQTGKLVNAPDKVFNDATGKNVTPQCMKFVCTNNVCVFVLTDIVSIHATVDGAVIDFGTYQFRVSINSTPSAAN